MIASILTSQIATHLYAVIVGAILAVFIYRNNRKAIDPTLGRVDAAWDKAELTDKINKLENKLNDLIKKN